MSSAVIWVIVIVVIAWLLLCNNTAQEPFTTITNIDDAGDCNQLCNDIDGCYRSDYNPSTGVCNLSDVYTDTQQVVFLGPEFYRRYSGRFRNGFRDRVNTYYRPRRRYFGSNRYVNRSPRLANEYAHVDGHSNIDGYSRAGGHSHGDGYSHAAGYSHGDGRHGSHH